MEQFDDFALPAETEAEELAEDVLEPEPGDTISEINDEEDFDEVGLPAEGEDPIEGFGDEEESL